MVLPYVQGVTGKTSPTLKQYDIAAAMKPYTILLSLLVHPKDKRDPANTTDAIYEIPNKNFKLGYIGETDRKFQHQVGGTKSEVNKVSDSATTRGSKKELLTITR